MKKLVASDATFDKLRDSIGDKPINRVRAAAAANVSKCKSNAALIDYLNSSMGRDLPENANTSLLSYRMGLGSIKQVLSGCSHKRFNFVNEIHELLDELKRQGKADKDSVSRIMDDIRDTVIKVNLAHLADLGGCFPEDERQSAPAISVISNYDDAPGAQIDMRDIDDLETLIGQR